MRKVCEVQSGSLGALGGDKARQISAKIRQKKHLDANTLVIPQARFTKIRVCIAQKKLSKLP
jgi:hypothetical protein